MAIRDLMKLPVIGLLALAAACGGGESSDNAAATTESAPAATTTTTETAAPAATTAPAAGATAPATGNVVEIKMVSENGGASGKFEPANVTVKKGDVIRWVMADAQAAHNVSFSMAQGNPAGFSAPADSPYLNQAGQTFDVTVTMEPGTYNYVCVPHMAMGMVGSITVQ
ncbi:plastocyanin/azurin family copper-binding protein [Longimicrobium terrae]|uniref:Plastocyanin n=1 Tax=Longimicrobium terrae TaxID=1639882 RepID=A0A841H1J5_9BACT|nr:plastocyanin/azurin family copper-binding protein [Longimicrobium terrae]MBB4637418.1 plastocyanin [Longimicrobium terrae]MBB6071816.1 plastocyanin [Longimicrobium terrae]NNC30366.1 hypothetical protein [Longimicrobium terrae]